MASYELVLYQSEYLADYCDQNWGNRKRALENAKTWVEGAFDRSDHSITVRFGDNGRLASQITLPTQEYQDDFCEKPCPRFDDECTEYGWLHNFIKDRVRCRGWEESDDMTITLTDANTTSGGSIYPWTHGFGVVQTGGYIAYAEPPYTKRGSAASEDAIQTLLHEIGHYTMAVGDGDIGHEAGDFYHEDSWAGTNDYITAMGIGEVDGEENYCGDYVGYDDDGFELYWSECCLSNW